MCGIAGFYGLPKTPQEKSALLNHMCAAITYRGPDDQGIYTDDQVGLGMRRLSIIDVAGGHQPMTNENKNLWIVFNGEIYNFSSLRQDLQKQGHHFTSSSDTEVILHQYEQDGPTCVDRFNGMFAFAIWDKKAQSLFLARDRLGIKPLYYYWDGAHFLFASELKALIASGLVPKDLDTTAVWDYLTLRYIPQPKTIWKNIFKLLPGHTLTLSKQNPVPTARRYWDIHYEPVSTSQSIAQYTEEFAKLFLDAVRIHLIADVPVGVLLSGGLDSSAVVAAIKEVHGARMDSFSVAFEKSEQINELPYARQVAQWAGSNHHEVMIGVKEFTDFLPKYAYFMDEPMADLASVPLYYVSRLAKDHVKVVMSGEGSDEIMGGYDFDRLVQNWDHLATFQRLPHWFRKVIVESSRLLGPTMAARFQKANRPVTEVLRTHPVMMTNLFSSDQKQSLFKEKVQAPDTLNAFRELMRQSATAEPLHQVLYLYCQSWLADDLLAKADRMTMANSLELRVPFLDHRLVEWLAKIPAWTKVGKKSDGHYVTKRILREFAKPRLPPEILSRPKQGFPVPAYEWLKGPLKQWASDLLDSADTRITRWLWPNEVKNLALRGTHPKSSPKDQQRLWQLLILELWLREWLA